MQFWHASAILCYFILSIILKKPVESNPQILFSSPEKQVNIDIVHAFLCVAINLSLVSSSVWCLTPWLERINFLQPQIRESWRQNAEWWQY